MDKSTVHVRNCMKIVHTSLDLNHCSRLLKGNAGKVYGVSLANHNGHRQYCEPIKTRSKCTQQAQSAGKLVRTSHYRFCFYFWLEQNVARDF